MGLSAAMGGLMKLRVLNKYQGRVKCPSMISLCTAYGYSAFNGGGVFCKGPNTFKSSIMPVSKIIVVHSTHSNGHNHTRGKIVFLK